MKCAICGIEIDSVAKAIDKGWVPCFYETDKEHGPVCASCSEKLICVGKDGEFELKEQYWGKSIYQHEDRKAHLVMGLCLGNFFQI